MTLLGMAPTLSEVEALVKTIDVNGDGNVDFEEFLLVMAGGKKTGAGHLAFSPEHVSTFVRIDGTPRVRGATGTTPQGLSLASNNEPHLPLRAGTDRSRQSVGIGVSSWCTSVPVSTHRVLPCGLTCLKARVASPGRIEG